MVIPNIKLNGSWIITAVKRYLVSLPTYIPYPIYAAVAPWKRMMPKDPIAINERTYTSLVIKLLTAIIKNGVNDEPNPSPKERP